MLFLVLLICGVNAQRLASSTVAVSGSNGQYDVKSAYFDNAQLLGCITAIDVKSLDFGFSFSANIVDTATNTCTIRAIVKLGSWDYNSLTLRFVLVSSTMNLQTMEINVTGAASFPMSSALGWTGATTIYGLLKGWSKLQSISSTFSITGSNISVASNLASGWVLYQLVLVKTADWSAVAGNITETVPKAASQVYGIVSAQSPKASIDCSGSNCQAVMNSSSYCLLGSN